MLKYDKELCKTLIHIVRENAPIKSTDLVVHLCDVFHASEIPLESINEYIEHLVKENMIVALEYTLPDIDYRIKTLYFPGGTKCKINT
jgi:hypothetical protein